MLRDYWMREFIHMIDDIRYIDTFSYKLMIKTLDYIKVGLDDIEVIFLP